MTDRTAARFVRLYPRAWRTRYGGEFMHVLTAQPMTLRLAADVIGGAIDARLRRQPRAGHEGDVMTAGLLKRCARGGSHLTAAEAWRAAAILIGASLVFSGLYIWAKVTLPDQEELVDAFGIMAYPAALIVTIPYYYMKDATRAAKVFAVLVSLLILAAASYLAALI